ncbi:hypothetical protein ACOMHN_016801 [Nucella lapillus]
MFSQKHYPVEKRNFGIENSGPFIFGPFSRQNQICDSTRQQRTEESHRSSQCSGFKVDRHYGDTAGGQRDSVDGDDQSGVSAVTADSLPTEEELKASGKLATAKIVHLLKDNYAAEHPEKPFFQLLLEASSRVQHEASAKVQSPQVPGICDILYVNDIVHRQLHTRGILGHLPQTHPKPYIWEADSASKVIPRTRVITVGYQIQYPRARKKSNGPEDIKVSGSSYEVNKKKKKLDIWLPQAGREKRVHMDTTTPVSSISFTPIQVKSKTCTSEGKAVPRLNHSRSEQFKTPWWVVHGQGRQGERKPPLSHSATSHVKGKR